MATDHRMDELSGPARRLFELLVGQVDAAGKARLPEAWVAQEMGCCPKRLREYRSQLNTAGLTAIRLYGEILHVQILPVGYALLGAVTVPQLPLREEAARGKCHAVRAESATREEVAREKCHAVRAESATLDTVAREKCHAERAKSATLDSAAREKCHAQRAKSATLDTVAREKCHAERAKSATLPLARTRARAGSVGRLVLRRVKLTNSLKTNQPTPQTPLPAAEVAVAELPAAVPVWAVAPGNPDYERNCRLLEDDELEIGNGENIEFLARNYEFERLLRQVFAWRRQREAKGLTPGALIYRLREHLRDNRLWRAGPLTAQDRQSDLYRRHMVLIAPDEPEPEPDEPEYEPEPEPELCAARTEPAARAPLPQCEEWDVARSQLRLQLPSSTWDAWVRDSGAELDAEAGLLTVYAPNASALEWLRLRLRRMIENTVTSIRTGLRVEFALGGEYAAVERGNLVATV